MAVRRTLALGSLSVRGTAFEFKPAGQLTFDAQAGDEIELGLTYSYEDTSPLKNSGRVVLTLDLGGAQHTAETEIRDRPMIDDRERRFLSRVLAVPISGDVYGRFRIEGELAEGEWRGGARAKTLFREEGTFLVKVR